MLHELPTIALSLNIGNVHVRELPAVSSMRNTFNIQLEQRAMMHVTVEVQSNMRLN